MEDWRPNVCMTEISSQSRFLISPPPLRAYSIETSRIMVTSPHTPYSTSILETLFYKRTTSKLHHSTCFSFMLPTWIPRSITASSEELALPPPTFTPALPHITAVERSLCWAAIVRNMCMWAPCTAVKDCLWRRLLPFQWPLHLVPPPTTFKHSLLFVTRPSAPLVKCR